MYTLDSELHLMTAYAAAANHLELWSQLGVARRVKTLSQSSIGLCLHRV